MEQKVVTQRLIRGHPQAQQNTYKCNTYSVQYCIYAVITCGQHEISAVLPVPHTFSSKFTHRVLLPYLACDVWAFPVPRKSTHDRPGLLAFWSLYNYTPSLLSSLFLSMSSPSPLSSLPPFSLPSPLSPSCPHLLCLCQAGEQQWSDSGPFRRWNLQVQSSLSILLRE